MQRTFASLFAVDDEWDLDRASDGISRFGHYLAERLGPDTVEGPGQWESFCWRVATPPTMSPGYVRLSPNVEDSSCAWDYDQGRGLVGTVHVYARLPERLVGWDTWDRQRDGAIVPPWGSDRSAFGRVTLETVLHGLVLWPVEFDALTLPHAELVAAAKHTVRDIARAMNAAFGEAAATVAIP